MPYLEFKNTILVFRIGLYTRLAQNHDIILQYIGQSSRYVVNDTLRTYSTAAVQLTFLAPCPPTLTTPLTHCLGVWGIFPPSPVGA